MLKGDTSMSQKNLVVFGENGRRLGGGAAQLRYIKQKGGWDEYHEELISDVTKEVYKQIMKKQSRGFLKKAN